MGGGRAGVGPVPTYTCSMYAGSPAVPRRPLQCPAACKRCRTAQGVGLGKPARRRASTPTLFSPQPAPPAVSPSPFCLPPTGAVAWVPVRLRQRRGSCGEAGGAGQQVGLAAQKTGQHSQGRRSAGAGRGVSAGVHTGARWLGCVLSRAMRRAPCRACCAERCRPSPAAPASASAPPCRLPLATRPPLRHPRPAAAQIENYLGHLQDPEAWRRAFYAEFEGDKRIKFSALRVLLERLHRQFDRQAGGRCRRSPA